MAAPRLAISAHDSSSYANNQDGARVEHSSFHLSVSFAEQVLRGSVIHRVRIVGDNVGHLVLDTSGLSIGGVQLLGGDASGKELTWRLGETHPAFGTPLQIDLPPSTKGSTLFIRVAYTTSPTASGIQFLPCEQTAGKKHPYLFTQCQAIHARSVAPVQDTPSNKFTYDGVVDVPKPLVALMSALRVEGQENIAAKVHPVNRSIAVTSDHERYHFHQPEPIPSYLLALAIGALESRPIGPRSSVWSEAEMVDAGAFEFDETEKFIQVGEAICGKYPWGRYDILLLPPSFPYGGMENPCLTFVTPTLLAGDKSLANVVAHEIAHSWFGNYVTSQTWEHFWMNEGFTVFLERKIMKALKGKPAQDLHAQIGLRDLQNSVDRFGHDHPFTCLVPKLTDCDPDDAFSAVPYERGFNFLTYLEGLVGGSAVMDPFLKAHCERYAHSTVNSVEWKPFFLKYMSEVAHIPQATLDSIDWDSWYHKSGMLPVSNTFDQSLMIDAQTLASKIVAGDAVSADAIKNFESAQVVILLETLLAKQKEVSADEKTKADFNQKLLKMDEVFHFTASKNAEIRFRWLTLCIRAPFPDRYDAVAALLKEQGRMKFVRPLYRDLYQYGGSGRDFALNLFKQIGKQYHLIAQKMVARDLGLDA